MPVCAPVRVRVCEEIVDENNSDNLELQRNLMKVVNTGHNEVLQGKTVDAGKVTSDIRKRIGLAS